MTTPRPTHPTVFKVAIALPAVAVVLGWRLANERLNGTAALAVLILSAVVLVSIRVGMRGAPVF